MPGCCSVSVSQQILLQLIQRQQLMLSRECCIITAKATVTNKKGEDHKRTQQHHCSSVYSCDGKQRSLTRSHPSRGASSVLTGSWRNSTCCARRALALTRCTWRTQMQQLHCIMCRQRHHLTNTELQIYTLKANDGPVVVYSQVLLILCWEQSRG